MDTTLTGSRRAALMLVSIGTMVWLLIAATPALAHEFKVGILLTPGAEGTPVDSSFMDGFQLAVDQSPDVSHPPGPDAGDHLGGVDVEMIVIDDTVTVDDLGTAALDLIEREGVVVIVTNVPSTALQAVFDTVTESRTLLLAASGTADDRFPSTPYFFAVGTQDEPTAEAFEAAFRETYKRTPSPDAALGYRVASLLDAAVSATGGDFTNEQALHDALTEASQSSAVPPESVEPSEVASPQPISQPETGRTRWITAFVALAVVMAVAVGWRTHLASRK